jgi:hypothetical protein
VSEADVLLGAHVKVRGQRKGTFRFLLNAVMLSAQR